MVSGYVAIFDVFVKTLIDVCVTCAGAPKLSKALPQMTHQAVDLLIYWKDQGTRQVNPGSETKLLEGIDIFVNSVPPDLCRLTHHNLVCI